MAIMEKLRELGIAVRKTEELFRGVLETEAGPVAAAGILSPLDAIGLSGCTRGVWFLSCNGGPVFPCGDYPVAIAEYNGHKHMLIGRGSKVPEEDIVCRFVSDDLYREFYHLAEDPELDCCFRYGYGTRSRDYLQEQADAAGLVRETEWEGGAGGREALLGQDDVLTAVDAGYGRTLIGKQGDLWTAQTTFSCAPDGGSVVCMQFRACPSEQDIRTAFAIRRFRQRPVEVFRCRGCGRLVHWTEAEGGILRKMGRASVSFCDACSHG